MAGHVFVSYSRQDDEYVRSVVEHLESAGLEVWSDGGIDHGERWMETIRERIDSCGAFIPIMSPSAERSKWVEREITRAEKMGKPILPLLLSGKPFFQLTDIQYEDVSGKEMPSRRYLDRLVEVLGVESPIVTPPPAPRPPLAMPTTTYVPRPYRRSRRTRTATLRALWTLAAGDAWMTLSDRVQLAGTRFALLAVVGVGVVTFVRHSDFPPSDQLTWLAVLGAAVAACAGAAYKKEWMFVSSVAVVIACRWTVVGTSVPEANANAIMALLLGMLLVADRIHKWPRSTLFRTFALVASVVAGSSWVYQVHEGHNWWLALLDRLRWFLPLIVVQAQLSWERDRGSRRVSGVMAATFGIVFATLAVLSLKGAASVGGTTGDRVLDVAFGLVLLAGGAAALRKTS